MVSGVRRFSAVSAAGHEINESFYGAGASSASRACWPVQAQLTVPSSHFAASARPVKNREIPILCSFLKQFSLSKFSEYLFSASFFKQFILWRFSEELFLLRMIWNIGLLLFIDQVL